MTSPRRLSSVLLALATAATLSPLAASPASAADRSAVTYDIAAVTSEATPDGTDVTTFLSAVNRTETRQGARTAYLSLVAADRDPGHQRAYRLGSVRVPALLPGDRFEDTSHDAAPRATVEGRYHVRLCSTPRAGNGTCTLSPRPSVRVGPAELALNQYDIGFDDTAPGETSAPVDAVVTNVGQSRTNRIRLAVAGGDHPGDFAVDPGTCTTWLAPGESCTAELTFSPPADATGIRNSWLRVGGRGRGDAIGASLVGTVVLADGAFTISPVDHDFGPVPVGASATYTFVISNNTDTDSGIGGSIDEADFAYDFSGPFTCLGGPVPAHGSCTFTVAFAPTSVGDQSAIAYLFVDGGDELLPLTGTGVAGEALATPRGQPTGGDVFGVR